MGALGTYCNKKYKTYLCISRRNWTLCEGKTSQSPQASPEESEPKTPFAPEPLDNQSWAAAKPSRVLFKVFPDVSPDRFSKVVVFEVPSFFQMRSNSYVSSQPPDAPSLNRFLHPSQMHPPGSIPHIAFPQMPLLDASRRRHHQMFSLVRHPYLSNTFTHSSTQMFDS